MTRRTAKAYEAVFLQMRNVNGFVNLRIILSDFQWGIRLSAAEVWPQAQLVGCNVHHDRVRTLIVN